MKDIEILEKTIKEFKIFGDLDGIQDLRPFMKAIENLLKENKAYKDRIKERIEELDKQEKAELKGMKGQDRYAVKQEYQHKRSILQELLGEKP